MAASSPSVNGDVTETKRNERQNQVMLGELPTDFLRVTPMTTEQQLANDMQTAMALQQIYGSPVVGNSDPVSGRLSISIIEAKLTKNYGMTRMDPYVRLRIGHTMYETHTATNGAKNPCWNKIFHCFLYPQASSLYIEIFDERAFTLDEKIAWTHYELPDALLRGVILDEWLPLNGRQGDGKEGFLHVIISYQPIPAGTLVYPQQSSVAVIQNPLFISHTVPYASTVPGMPVPVQQPAPVPQVAPPPARVEITDVDVEQVKEMFPSVEVEVVRSVLESQNGNKDKAINVLLAMSEAS